MRTAGRAIGGVNQEGIDQHPFAIEKNVIAALKPAESPPLAAGGPARAQPVHQYQSAVGPKVKLLRLPVGGPAESLNWIRRKHEQRTGVQRCMEPMAAGTASGIAVHFGRSLGTDKAAGLPVQFQGHICFITGNKSTAEAAQISPDTRPARLRDQYLQRARGPDRGDRALTGNHPNFKIASPSANTRYFRRR